MRSDLSKLKYFTDHFFWKVFTLSIICNYFPLGVAVPASIIKGKKAKAQEGQETLGARRLPAPPRPPQPAPGPVPTDRVFHSRRRDWNRPRLESRRRGTSAPPFKVRGAPRPLPPPAQGARTRAQHSPSPLAGPPPPPRRCRTPGRSQVQTSPPLRGGGAGHRRGFRPHSTMGGSAAPCAAARRLLRLRRGGSGARGSRGPESRLAAPGGAGAPDDHASRHWGRAGGAALSRGSPPGNPTGSLRDWPWRSSLDLHFNGREGSPRFEKGFRDGRVGLHSPLRGLRPPVLVVLRGPTQTRAVSPFSAHSPKGDLPPPTPPHEKESESKIPTLRSPRSLFRGHTVSNWSNEAWMKQGKKFTAWEGKKKKSSHYKENNHLFSSYVIFSKSQPERSRLLQIGLCCWNLPSQSLFVSMSIISTWETGDYFSTMAVISWELSFSFANSWVLDNIHICICFAFMVQVPSWYS